MACQTWAAVQDPATQQSLLSALTLNHNIFYLHKSKPEVLVEVRGGEISGHRQRSLGEQLAVLANLLTLEKHLERHF